MMEWHGDPYVKNFIDGEIIGEGIVIDEPSPKESYTRLIVKLISIEGTPIQKTNILVDDLPYSSITYGDKILIQGKVVQPENFETDAGRIFDYKNYLAKSSIYFEVKHADVSLLEKHQANRIKEFIFLIKQKSIEHLNHVLPFPQSGLAAGLIIAGKQGLPQAIQDEFQTTGTMQVLVLSGFNVTIIAEIIMLMCSRLPRLLGLSVSAFSIVVFAIAAGGSATIVRAVVMVFIVLGSKYFHRTYNVGRSLFAAALIMLMINPMLLFYDPSFQLSFLATFGLIYVTPIFKKYFLWVPDYLNLRETVTSTVATQLFVTPFLIYMTGSISLIAVVANAALSLIVPLTMLTSFVTLFVSFISPLFTMPFALLAYACLSLMLAIVHFSAHIPFASVAISVLPGWCVMLLYCCFAVFLYKLYTKKNPARGGVERVT